MKTTAYEITKKLQDSGYIAYWAGGSVRDILLAQRPKDYDIATSATPEQVKALFPESIPVGKAFGVMLVPTKAADFEIATFRKESDYSDGRRPDTVEFTEAEVDAQRRDFTINGLFYDPIIDQVHDFVAGTIDLNNKLIRFIGNAADRITEDNLRILRAVRFKNVLGFNYHPDTYQALLKYKDLVKNISKERVREELSKMLQNKNRVDALNDLEDLGILKLLLPEIQSMKGVGQPHKYHKEGDVYQHTMQALASMPEGKPLGLYWAVLLHDSGKVETFEVREDRIHFDGHAERSAQIARLLLRRLGFSNTFINKVSWLCEKHMSILNVLEMPKKAQMKWFLKPYYLDLLELHKADVLGTNPADLSAYKEIRSLYNKSVRSKPEELPKLLSGEEIMQICNLEAGPELGGIIKELRELQLSGEVTTKIQALHWLKNKTP